MVTKELLKDYVPFWNQLPAKYQDLLEKTVERRSVKKGTIVHNGEMDCLGLLVIITGSLKAYTVSEDGKAITLYRILERDMCLFSASCVMQNIDFEIVIEAREDADVLIIPVKVYQEMVKTVLPVANYSNELMASRFSDVMWVMDQVLNKSFDARLAGFMLEEASLNDDLTLKMTHEEIAQYLGTAREVVSRMLKYFQTEEIVTISRGKVQILDVKGLEKIAGNSLR